jgi:hypothetical protein
LGLFDDSLQLLPFELLEELLIGPGLLQVPVGAFGFALLGPDAPFGHLRFDLGVFVVVDVVTTDLLSPEFGQATGEQFDDDVLRVVDDVSELDFVDLSLNDEGEGLA